MILRLAKSVGMRHGLRFRARATSAKVARMFFSRLFSSHVTESVFAIVSRDLAETSFTETTLFLLPRRFVFGI